MAAQPGVKTKGGVLQATPGCQRAGAWGESLPVGSHPTFQTGVGCEVGGRPHNRNSTPTLPELVLQVSSSGK